MVQLYTFVRGHIFCNDYAKNLKPRCFVFCMHIIIFLYIKQRKDTVVVKSVLTMLYVTTAVAFVVGDIRETDMKHANVMIRSVKIMHLKMIISSLHK